MMRAHVANWPRTPVDHTEGYHLPDLQLDGSKRTILFTVANSLMGGVEVVARNILLCIDRSEFNVIICTTHLDGLMEEDFKRLSDCYFPLSNKKLGIVNRPGFDDRLSIMRRIVERYNIDICHVFNSWEGYHLAKEFSGKVIINIHGDYSNELQFFTTRVRTIKQLSDITVVTDTKSNVKLFGKKVDIQYVPNGVDSPDMEMLFNVKRIDKRIIWVGRDSGEKRIDVMLKVAEIMPDHEFVAAVTQQRIRQDVPENVTVYYDVIDRQFLYRLYVSSSIYLNTSDTEGLPLTLLEALKSGCYPICSAVGNIPEKIKGVGSLVRKNEPENYKRAILKYEKMDREERDRKREKLIKLGEGHNIEDMFSRIEMIYKGGG